MRRLEPDDGGAGRRGEASEAIGQAGLGLCKSVSRRWRRFRARQITRASLWERLKPLREKMHKLLKRGARLPVKETSGFRRDVLALGPALWTFATARGIEPTNNHAERMRRPAA